MAKKRNNHSGAHRPSGGTANATKSATATATQPAVKATPTNATAAKSANTGAQNQSDRIAAARARNAAARAAADRRRSMQGGWLRRQWPMVAAVVTVLLLIAVFFAISRNGTSGSASIGSPVPASVMSKVTGVSQTTFEKVGKGTIANPFKATQGNPPVNKDKDGKPIFLYVGGDYCPYCAAERWSLMVALSRFGTFNNVSLMQSSSSDVYPNTSTFSFHGASYSSQYLDFQGMETANRDQQAQDKLNSDQQAIFDKYDAPPYIGSQYAGSIPFLSVGNQYIEISAGFIPDQMQGLTWQQIADKLNDPNNSVTQSIMANANYITAAICQVTDNKPANVCTAAPIPAIISDMKAGK
jgi:thiol-disulfide isomerase/thioredoxin